MAVGTPVAQGNHVGTLASGNITTLATIATGDMILLIDGMGTNGSGFSAITDPIPNTYSLLNEGTNPTLAVCSAWASNVTGFASGSTLAITYGASSGRATQALSIPGMWATTATAHDTLADVAVGSSTATTSATLTTKSLAQSDSLVIAVLYTSGTDPGAVTWGAFTAIGGTSATRFMKVAYLKTTAGTPVVAPVSWVNSAAYRYKLLVFRGVATNSGGVTDMMSQVGA